MWIVPRHPAFAAQAGRVLDLESGWWEGRPLGAPDDVLSAAEQTSIQARWRCAPSRPAIPGQPRPVEFEYERLGAVHYLAAWDGRRGLVVGRCAAHTGIVPFGRLVAQVMGQAPDRSADRVFWIVDNGSSQRGAASIRRLTTQYPNLILVHLPLHARWLNQIEIYCSIIQRTVLTPNDFAHGAALERRLVACEQRRNAAPRPFAWRFTGADLDRRLHDHPAPALPLPEVA